MFFGQAKQLCPGLQAVPYDFEGYKEVATAMYETLARYRPPPLPVGATCPILHDIRDCH